MLLSYFKINDPYRLLSILLFLIVIRLPYFISDVALTIPELKWMVLGEKVSGDSMLYSDVWDHTAPLAAFVYFLIDFLFGRSLLVYQILGLILVFIQASLLNLAFIAHKTFKEITFIPAMVYVVLMHLFYDQMTLSPILMSMTVLVLVFHQVFLHIENKTSDESILKTGFLIGLAGLFHLTSLLYVIPVIFSYAIFTGTQPRKYLMLIYGLALPLLLSWAWFFWNDSLSEYYLNFFQSLIILPSINYLNNWGYVLLMLVPIIFLFLSIIKIVQFSQFNNLQVRFQAVMFFFLVISVGIWFLSKEKSTFQFTILAPALSFFISHFFLLIRRKLFAEISFGLFIGLILLINYGTYFGFLFTANIIDFQKLKVDPTPYDDLVKGKNILYIGRDIDVYQHAKLATPYLNYGIAKVHLNNPQYYDNLTAMYKNFTIDAPEVIIDKEGVIPALFDKMPIVAQRYRQGSSEEVYILQ